MVSEEQIIETTKKYGGPIWEDGTEFEWTELHNFAQHFYKQGLLDAAEKCEALHGLTVNRLVHADGIDCAEALRNMAEEVGK